MGNIRDIMELLYFASSPLLLITLIIGLKQLKIHRRDIELRSQREAAACAADKCSLFFSDLIPKVDELDDLLEKHKLTPPEFDKNFTGFSQTAIPEILDVVFEFMDKLEKIEKKLKQDIKIYRVLNSLEAFSTYFIKGIADEELAFSSIGESFCELVKSYQIFYCLHRSDDKTLYFSNTIQLYKLWDSRLTSSNLEGDLKRIKKQLSKLQNEKVKPIGTSLNT